MRRNASRCGMAQIHRRDTEGDDRLVVPSAVGGLAFLDEASTANTYAAILKRQGVNAIVLLIHEGGRQRPHDSNADPNQCDDFSGDIAVAGRATAGGRGGEA